jgi:hypothetical protein
VQLFNGFGAKVGNATLKSNADEAALSYDFLI